MLQRTVLLLLVGCTIHSSAEAFPVGFLDGIENIVNGVDDLTDWCGVLFIPCVVTFVLTKRAWLKATTGIVWFIDLIISPAYILYHIAATGMLVMVTLFLRWLNTKWKLHRA